MISVFVSVLYWIVIQIKLLNSVSAEPLGHAGCSRGYVLETF